MIFKGAAVLAANFATPGSAGSSLPDTLCDSAAIGSRTAKPVDSPGSKWNICNLVDLPPRGIHGSWLNQRIAKLRNAAQHQLRVARMSGIEKECHARQFPKCEWCYFAVPWKPGVAENLGLPRPTPAAESGDLGADAEPGLAENSE